MTITAEEKLMYEVMKVIYESGIPMSFKGAMVLKACLMEAGLTDNTRHTVDIDANWISDTPPSSEQMVTALQTALNKNGINLNVNIYRMYGEGRSAGFELTDQKTGEMLFSMDIDVNRPIASTKIYAVNDLHFRGVSPLQMIADKVFVISTNKIFRRIKDVIDLYYLSKVFDIERAAVLQTLSESNRHLENFDGFLHRTDELRHSYEKFRFTGSVNKPLFDDIYYDVKTYLKDILPKENAEA